VYLLQVEKYGAEENEHRVDEKRSEVAMDRQVVTRIGGRSVKGSVLVHAEEHKTPHRTETQLSHTQ
jgi:hypothetical protein